MTAIVIGQSLGNAYSSCPTPRVRMEKATQGTEWAQTVG